MLRTQVAITTNVTRFNVDVRSDLPETEIIYQPYLEVISFLIFLAGTISLWLGSSLYASPIQVTENISQWPQEWWPCKLLKYLHH